MARPSPFENARSFVSKGGMPITMATLAVAAAMFVAWWATKQDLSWLTLAFTAADWLSRPWSLVTYAIVEASFLRLACSGLMAFFFMGALERAWARERFLPAYFAFLIVPPISIWMGHLLTGEALMAMGLWLPVASWTVAFGAYRPQSTILVFGIAPVKAMWIAWFTALAVVFTIGAGAPLAGLCAGLAMAVAWLFGSRRVSLRLPRKEPAVADEFRKSMKTKREAEAERLKLRELLERSVQDDERE